MTAVPDGEWFCAKCSAPIDDVKVTRSAAKGTKRKVEEPFDEDEDEDEEDEEPPKGKAGRKRKAPEASKKSGWPQISENDELKSFFAASKRKR